MFRDIRPYVCTFKDCPRPDYLFSSQYEWFEHEQLLHRRSWFCNACDTDFHAATVFRDHLIQKHSGLFGPSELQIIVDRAERSTESDQPCPLCGEELPPQKLQRHLAGHMQLHALALLPCASVDDEEGDSNSEDELSASGSVDTHWAPVGDEPGSEQDSDGSEQYIPESEQESIGSEQESLESEQESLGSDDEGGDPPLQPYHDDLRPTTGNNDVSDGGFNICGGARNRQMGLGRSSSVPAVTRRASDIGLRRATI